MAWVAMQAQLTTLAIPVCPIHKNLFGVSKHVLIHSHCGCSEDIRWAALDPELLGCRNILNQGYRSKYQGLGVKSTPWYRCSMPTIAYHNAVNWASGVQRQIFKAHNFNFLN